MKIHKVERTDEIGNDNGWSLWRCEVEMEDGSIRTGFVQGDEHSTAEETLELDEEEPKNLNGWLRPSQQMPPIDTPVLAIIKGEVRTAITHMEHPTFEDTYQSFAYWDDPHNDGQCWEYDDVTYWMPIPALPL